MKKLLNEWKKFLKEQEDGGDRREKGPGVTTDEDEAMDARKRFIEWASKLQPHKYRQFLQVVKEKMDDSMEKAIGVKVPYKFVVNSIALASKGKVTPNQAVFFEALMASYDIKLDQYGYDTAGMPLR